MGLTKAQQAFVVGLLVRGGFSGTVSEGPRWRARALDRGLRSRESAQVAAGVGLRHPDLGDGRLRERSFLHASGARRRAPAHRAGGGAAAARDAEPQSARRGAQRALRIGSGGPGRALAVGIGDPSARLHPGRGAGQAREIRALGARWNPDALLPPKRAGGAERPARGPPESIEPNGVGSSKPRTSGRRASSTSRTTASSWKKRGSFSTRSSSMRPASPLRSTPTRRSIERFAPVRT
jgi:hypothetical protein